MTTREQLYQYKGNRCASCGLSVKDMLARYGTFNRMFEFHHVNKDTKDKHYKRLMAQRLSTRQIAEVDKCVLLCRQCHGIMHAQEITCTMELSVQLNQRTVKQEVKGRARFDKFAKQFTVVTNQSYLLELCEIRVGNEDPVLMFLIEVEKEMNLQRWLFDIARYRKVEIISRSGRHRFMRIEYVGENKVAVTQSLGLPITAIEFHPANMHDEIILLKNGVVLTASGEIHSRGQLSYHFTLLPHPGAESDS